ncbi:alpha-N-acetylglucosaminidase [Flavihumibacter sp. CACIAM 22H1]|uniref:alpha-N-acetylglucosaminidase n=1 Tax=Flavihumibacter sp. CACIAM 22H1 TaxID=1812911 RepID=UPI0007A87C40|nr:alpha-N-acetylglucosaminidase [Flavihumibacter sp. CACIAM 22H1]KYP15992.1 MAG: hypothetical protein A1D16_06950 [Flavihumibacter sp. CACIAM 22H1]
MYKPFFLSLVVLGSYCCQAQTKPDPLTSTRALLQRVLGEKAATIRLALDGTHQQTDRYLYKSSNNSLYVSGNSTVALARGVYDYFKDQGLGMMDWAGHNFDLQAAFPEVKEKARQSPFKIRQAFNAVTPGYTTPFWTWERWEKELDWQAMHGFNMLMAPVATEAIAARVWKKLGLTQQEIDSFYVSPALLPWQRMGNIQQVGGTLSPAWHKEQIALQHKILGRMRALGMEPIVQSFAGFVPKAIKRIYPSLVLHETLWNDGFAPAQRPSMILPDEPLFKLISRLYMEEWRKEFGKATYYLVDSFNELELPDADKPPTELLAEIGKLTFEAIDTVQKDAVWVIQGWMFGYQQKQWPPKNVKALFSKVPDNRLLILDYANDYATTWATHNGFNGKQWAYGFVPNMGGKTAYTGNLQLYANGAATTLKDPNRKNLVGFSLSGEGLENNAVVYELLTDAAWSAEPIDFSAWIKSYAQNRYGAFPADMQKSWDLLLKSSYSYLVDHPQFNWQTARFSKGRVDRSAEFYTSVKLFLACRQAFQHNTNYVADAVERAALVLGLKAEDLFFAAAKAYENNAVQKGDQLATTALEMLTNLDRLLESHPLNRLDRWLYFAASGSKDTMLVQQKLASARRIITIWGPPVNDYSCRLWAGLVRDFYRPRMNYLLNQKRSGIAWDKNAWELNWVEHAIPSRVEPFPNPVEFAAALVDGALELTID